MPQPELPLTRMSLIAFLQDPAARDPETVRRAWGEFVELYGPVVLRWCRRACPQPADAEDTAQGVLTRLFEAIGTYERPRGAFRGWLKAVVRRAAVDVWRARQRGPAALDETRLQAPPPAALADLEDGLAGAAGADLELAREVVACVRRRVQPHTWEAFYRYKVLGKEPADVAAGLEVSVGVVHNAASKVERLLRQEKERLRGQPSE